MLINTMSVTALLTHFSYLGQVFMKSATTLQIFLCVRTICLKYTDLFSFIFAIYSRLFNTKTTRAKNTAVGLSFIFITLFLKIFFPLKLAPTLTY